jgi:hypothetical protein
MSLCEICVKIFLKNSLLFGVRGVQCTCKEVNDKANKSEVLKMKNIEMMKEYLRNNNLTHLVRELVSGLGMDVNSAIEYVYDGQVLNKEQFSKKYFR